MRLINVLSMLAMPGILLTANVGAAPITFQFVLPNATGENNFVPFTKQTVVITVQADTSQITPVAHVSGGGAGNCVPAISASIAVGGGTALQAAAPVYLCSPLDTTYVGVFTTPDAVAYTYYFLADYSGAGITNYALASNFPLTRNVYGHASPSAVFLNLAGGGKANLSDVSFFSEDTFVATLAIADIPALGEVNLWALAALLVLVGMVAVKHRKPL